MIYYEMLTHVPMCSHEKNSLEVCVIGGNEHIMNELNYYKTNISQFEDESALADIENQFDVIISTKFVSSVYLNKSLKENGVAVQPAKDLEDVELFEKVGKLMYINQPYWFFDEQKNFQTILFSSKKYHPQADISRHKSDFIEHTKYYNTDMHLGSFNYPNQIFKNIIKHIKV